MAPVGGRSFNRGQNASWERDSWYRGTEKESVEDLTQRLRSRQVRDVFFHARFIQKDGSLRFRTGQSARRLCARMKILAPQMRSIAWVYVGNERGLTGVDISRPEVRARMVGEAKWLVRDCGFDGVHWDYEICEDANPSLLLLLHETRAALPPGKLLSVASGMWLPGAFSAWGWSEEYFAHIARECDQIVVMGYDSGLYFPRHYARLMREQAIRVTRSVAQSNPDCRVLIGVPTYEEGGWSHHSHAENLRMALRGVREGLADARSAPPVFQGVAIFAGYTTGAREQSELEELWLK